MRSPGRTAPPINILNGSSTAAAITSRRAASCLEARGGCNRSNRPTRTSTMTGRSVPSRRRSRRLDRPPWSRSRTFFVNPASSGPQLLFGGTYAAAGEFGAWKPIGAEQTVGGYEVAWKNGAADQYLVWNTDGSGRYLSQSSVMTGASSALQRSKPVSSRISTVTGRWPSSRRRSRRLDRRS